MLGKKTSNRGRNPLVWLAPYSVAATAQCALSLPPSKLVFLSRARPHPSFRPLLHSRMAAQRRRHRVAARSALSPSLCVCMCVRKVIEKAAVAAAAPSRRRAQSGNREGGSTPAKYRPRRLLRCPLRILHKLHLVLPRKKTEHVWRAGGSPTALSLTLLYGSFPSGGFHL